MMASLLLMTWEDVTLSVSPYLHASCAGPRVRSLTLGLSYDTRWRMQLILGLRLPESSALHPWTRECECLPCQERSSSFQQPAYHAGA